MNTYENRATREEYNKEIKEDIKGTSYSYTLKIRVALS